MTLKKKKEEEYYEYKFEKIMIEEERLYIGNLIICTTKRLMI